MSLEETESPVKMACLRCHEQFDEATQVCPHDGSRLIMAVRDPMLGTTFADRYEIIEVIGRGGMSVVYKAQQKFMHNFVAIKVLHEQLNTDPSNFERFKTEARAAISIRHPNVIQVLDFGITPDNQAFLIMEFLKGQDLSDWLEKNGDMPVERALNIFIQACDGLAAAHGKGVIHRDLKPSNLVLLKEDGATELVKIVDFGIAKIKPQDGTPAQNLTNPGEVFGSPLYMSPEQCQGLAMDSRSDIYSLGCVMYETLTGMPPLMGINSFETMNKHVHEQPLPLRGMVPSKNIPELIDATVLKAIRKNPDDRPQSMDELKKSLIEAAGNSNIYFHESPGYAAQMFTGETGSHSTVQEGAASAQPSGSASKEMQKLVLDAVDLTQKQAKKNKQLRVLIMVLYCLIGIGIVTVANQLTKPGPPSDPAPMWRRMEYLAKINDAETAKAANKFKDAADDYEQAANIAETFGDGNDKKVKSLFGLLSCLERSGASQDRIKAIRQRVLDANMKHMEYIFNLDPRDLSRVVDMDNGLLERAQGDKLDSTTADGYSKRLVEDAKFAFRKHNYVKAISWLQEALEMEEQAHGKGDVAQTAAQFAAEPLAKQHESEIKKLLERALVAEKDDKR